LKFTKYSNYSGSFSSHP